MRAVAQRVSRARVTIGDRTTGEVGSGLLVLLGIARSDVLSDADYLVDKIFNLRIFEDAESNMNRSLLDTKGDLLVVSQFTLYGDTRRGRRPSFVNAASGQDAISLYDHFIAKARGNGLRVETGEFGAMMDVELVNDGPVTIILDSEKTF